MNKYIQGGIATLFCVAANYSLYAASYVADSERTSSRSTQSLSVDAAVPGTDSVSNKFASAIRAIDKAGHEVADAADLVVMDLYFERCMEALNRNFRYACDAFEKQKNALAKRLTDKGFHGKLAEFNREGERLLACMKKSLGVERFYRNYSEEITDAMLVELVQQNIQYLSRLAALLRNYPVSSARDY